MAVTIKTGYTDDPLPQLLREDYPFAHYADSRRHPLLYIAARNSNPAHSYKVEWLVDQQSSSGSWQHDTWENFTQIVRTPFTPRDDSDRDLFLALEKHLDEVEQTLWYGTPSYERNGSFPIGFCGGVLHYLGRQPVYEDKIILRPLQDLVLLRNRDDRVNSPHRTHEFLSEFSLQVNPAATIVPYRPPAVRWLERDAA